MHRLRSVEPSCLEQLVRRRAATAPAKVAAAAFARVHALLDLAIDGLEQRLVLDVREPVCSDMTEGKVVESGVTRAQEFR
jgi:hypothetical protein